jgi:hypothetical protein
MWYIAEIEMLRQQLAGTRTGTKRTLAAVVSLPMAAPLHQVYPLGQVYHRLTQAVPFH